MIHFCARNSISPTPTLLLIQGVRFVRWHALNSHICDNAPDEVLDEDAEWSELEKMLPSNSELLASARKHRAPQEWYDETIDPR